MTILGWCLFGTAKAVPLQSALMGLGRRGVAAGAGFDEAGVDLFPLEAGCGGCWVEDGFGGFEELFVVAIGEVGFGGGAAGLVARARALDNDAAEFEHVVELAGEGEAGVGPLALVGEIDFFVAVEELDDLGVRFIQACVIADDGGVLGHG